MSTFEVKARTVTVEDHPDADRLDIVRPNGTAYICVSQKGVYQTGDLAVYVPEGALVPEQVLKDAHFWDEEKGKGMLAGSKGDRVKAVRLRGQVSQGILLRPSEIGLEVTEGEDYAEALEITKYMPPIPLEMAGRVERSDIMRTFTDIENVKANPDWFVEGDSVVMTEKLHGTCVIFAKNADTFEVASKGIAGKGMSLVEETNNIYWRVARSYGIEAAMQRLWDESLEQGGTDDEVIYLYGEVLGVQDLDYGLAKGQLELYLFDMSLRIPAISPDPIYTPQWVFQSSMEELGLPRVPVVYEGIFSEEALEKATNGDSLIEGANHIREGVVVKAIGETDFNGPRAILKSVSDAYLLRKGMVTEWE